MRHKWLNIAVIILTVVIALLQLLPQPVEDEFFAYTYLREHSIKIVFIVSVLVILVHLYDIFVEKTSIQQKWTKRFLKHIIYQHLGGDNYHTRISILRARKGWRIFPGRLYHYVFRQFIENFKNHTWIVSLRQIPIHLFSDYLIVYERYSFPKDKRSYTYFLIPESSTEYNSLAVKCYKEGVDQQIMTEYISDIPLPRRFETLSTTNKKRVRKYMKDSFISESNYQTLLSLRQKSNNIYATPIFDEDQRIWGVFIIDNNEKDAKDFKKELEPVAGLYMKLYSFTTTYLKMK